MIRSNWKVYRLTLTSANTEYSQELTNNIAYALVGSTDRSKGFYISLKPLQVPSGTQTGSEYRTIFAGTAWESRGKMLGTKTIYLSSANAGQIIEIEEWS